MGTDCSQFDLRNQTFNYDIRFSFQRKISVNKYKTYRRDHNFLITIILSNSRFDHGLYYGYESQNSINCISAFCCKGISGTSDMQKH